MRLGPHVDARSARRAVVRGLPQRTQSTQIGRFRAGAEAIAKEVHDSSIAVGYFASGERLQVGNTTETFATTASSRISRSPSSTVSRPFSRPRSKRNGGLAVASANYSAAGSSTGSLVGVAGQDRG